MFGALLHAFCFLFFAYQIAVSIAEYCIDFCIGATAGDLPSGHAFTSVALFFFKKSGDDLFHFFFLLVSSLGR